VAQSFNIGKAGSTTTVTVKGATYDGLTHGGTANATGAGNLSQSLTVVYSGRNGTTYGPSKTAPADAGDYTAAASFDGDESHEASNDTKDFNIAKATAAITLGDLNQTYTGTARNATASTNPSGLSGITISYSRNAAPVASPVNSGSYEVLASLTNSNYQADNAAGTLVIDKATATITLTDLAHTYDGSAKAASATTDPAGRNVSISYSLSGQTIATPTNAGSYLVTAKIDDANYQGSATATLVIERAAPVITWASPVDITFGTALGNAQLNATASVAGAFAYTPAAGTALNAGAGQTLSVNFTPTDAANYNTVSKSVLINVSKATPEITWSSPANITFGTALGAAQLNATANAAGAFTYTPAAGTVLNAGNSQSLSVSFVPTDTNNNNAATKSVSINVLKADQTITFNALANKIFGDAPFNLSATSTSGQTVSFSIVLGPATLSGDQLTIKGIGHVIVRASLIGDSNHNAAPAVDRAFDVTTASATIALSNLLQTFDGTAKAPTVVTTPAGLSFNLTYSRNGQAVASPTGAGNYNVTATVTDPNYQGSANAILVVNKATPTLAWNAPANIASGTALSATQLNATANVAGAFTYDPPLGTILSVGLNQLSVTFIPTDSANFTNASQTVQLTVEQLTSNEINLSQSIYNASEADGHVTITVNRTGDTTGAAAIEYATPDTAGLQNCSVLNGVALQRCDYAMTTGTLRFAPGETSKTIDIALVDDSYAEGPESFTITLSNPVGEGLGTVSTATVTVADNEATNGVNPVADPAFFVRQHYMDFLNREPDPQGFADWLNVLNNCPQGSITCDRIEVSSGFFRSPEFRERGYFPYRFYVVSLGRKPNFAEFMPDLARVSGFLTEAEKEQARRDFIAGFMSRAEFTTIYNGLSDLAYVQRLFDTAGVTQVTVNGSVQTVETMLQQLASGKSRAQVLREMVESTEVDAKFFNEAFVVMQYFGYLRRDPDALFTQWIETLDRTGDYRTMINGFINSDEYVQRFGP
jgi:hypothetical protein